MGHGVSSYIRQEKGERLDWILSLAATLLRNVVNAGINTRLLTKYSVRTAQQTHSVSVTKTSQLTLYRQIIAVCSQSHTKHINTLCGQNGEFFNIMPNGTYIVFTALQYSSSNTLPTSVCNVWRYNLFISVFICSLFNDAVSSSDSRRRMAR